MRKAFHPEMSQITVVDLLRGLSDSLRLEIVNLLYHNGEMQCWNIYETLGISPSNASHHFRMLRECGIIIRTHQGQQQHANIRTEELNTHFPGLLGAILSNFTSQYDLTTKS